MFETETARRRDSWPLRLLRLPDIDAEASIAAEPTPATVAATLLVVIGRDEDALTTAAKEARSLVSVGQQALDLDNLPLARRAAEMAAAALEEQKTPVTGYDLIQVCELCVKSKSPAVKRLSKLTDGFKEASAVTNRERFRARLSKPAALAWLGQGDAALLAVRKVVADFSSIEGDPDAVTGNAMELGYIAGVLTFNGQAAAAGEVMRLIPPIQDPAHRWNAEGSIMLARMQLGAHPESALMPLIQAGDRTAQELIYFGVALSVRAGCPEASLRPWVDGIENPEMRLIAAVGVLHGLTDDQMHMLRSR